MGPTSYADLVATNRFWEMGRHRSQMHTHQQLTRLWLVLNPWSHGWPTVKLFKVQNKTQWILERKFLFVGFFLMKGTADKDRREIGMGEGESNQIYYAHCTTVKEQLITNIWFLRLCLRLWSFGLLRSWIEIKVLSKFSHGSATSHFHPFATVVKSDWTNFVDWQGHTTPGILLQSHGNSSGTITLEKHNGIVLRMFSVPSQL